MKGIKIALVVKRYGHFTDTDQTAGFMSCIKLTILLPKQSKLSKMSSPNIKK